MDFYQKQFDSACRKYEEAYSIWHYYYTTNPKWNTEGIDDTHLFEVEWQGQNKDETEQALKHKIVCLLNITACNIKSKNYLDALPPVNQALTLDPNNQIALFRKAHAVSLPINSSVEDLMKA
jgi:tetratricopeptide (TPR) repeat protein